MKNLRFALLGLGLAAYGPHAVAQSYDCPGASRALQQTSRDLASAIQKYSGCVSVSAGKDDCADPFARVRNAQADFERAVLDNKRYCTLG